MKKRLVALIMVMALALSLVPVGATGDSNTPSEAETTQATNQINGGKTPNTISTMKRTMNLQTLEMGRRRYITTIRKIRMLPSPRRLKLLAQRTNLTSL